MVFSEVTTSEESELGELRVGKLRNGKAEGKDEVRIWKQCSMKFLSGVVSGDWKSAVIISLYKVKGR